MCRQVAGRIKRRCEGAGGPGRGPQMQTPKGSLAFLRGPLTNAERRLPSLCSVVSRLCLPQSTALRMLLQTVVGKLFCNKPDNTYLRLCGALSQLLNSVALEGKQS